MKQRHLSRPPVRNAASPLVGRRSALLFGLVAFSGFAHAAEDRERTSLDLMLQAADGVNPDEAGRPSPIRVVIYELKDALTFLEADYFSLADKDRTVLANDLLARDEFIMRPGEYRRLQRKSDPATTALGFLAGYRDLTQSTWRAVFRLKPAPEAAWYRALVPANRAALNVNLQAQGVVVAEL